MLTRAAARRWPPAQARMLTKGAVEDLIMQHLRPAPGAAPAVRKVPELKKRTFISDWELRRLYRPGAKSVTVPLNAIISPLSLDWLGYNGVELVRTREGRLE